MKEDIMGKYETPFMMVIDLSDSISTALNGSNEGDFTEIENPEDIF
jgi:hypothetical protein